MQPNILTDPAYAASVSANQAALTAKYNADTAARNAADAAKQPAWLANVKKTAAENEAQMTSSSTSLAGQPGYVAPRPTLIATSDKSQNLYNENVNKMNAANMSYTNNGAGGTSTGTSTDSGTTTTTSNEVTNSDGSVNENSNLYKHTVGVLENGINTAKSALEAARATLLDDPVANAAVQAVMAKYDEQIRIMKDKNALVAGNNSKNSARYGSAQYATTMDNNFLSDQQERASQRIAELVTQQTIQANAVRTAYKTGNLKAFNDAQAAYDKANKEKVDAINTLLVESHKQVAEQQAALKLEQTNARNNLTDEIKLSTNLGQTIADTLMSTPALADKKKRDQYIQEMATKYGIDNIDVLNNAIVKAEQTATRQDLLNKSTLKSINKTTGNKVTTPKGVTFNTKEKAELTGYGLTGTDTTKLSQDIYKHGIDAVLGNPSLDENTKNFLKTKYNK